MKKKFRVSKLLKSALVAVLLVCLVTMSIPVSFAARTPSVVSVDVDDVEIIEYTNGYYDGGGFDENGNFCEWYYYELYSFINFTVTLSDGRVLDSYWGSAYDDITGIEYHLDYVDDQSYYNPWGVGTHTLTAEVSDVTTTFDINIVDSPVQSIAVNDKEIIENTNREYVPVEFESDYGYYIYDYNPLSFTVTLKDGSVIPCEEGYFEYNGEYYPLDCSDDQCYDNQWKVGTHNVKARLMGAEDPFTVSIIESPVQSIAVDNVEIIEGTHMDYAWDDYDNEYEYYTYVPGFTATLKDGSVIPCEEGYFVYNGEYYQLDCTDDQSCENQWGIGAHIATASLLGVEDSFSVTITETPIQSIAVNNVEIIEGTNMEDDLYYYYPSCTVTLKDGSVILCEENYIEYNGEEYWIEFTDDQSYDNQWRIGAHSVTASLMGVESTFTVTITETPIKSISVPDVNIIENANLDYYYDENENEYLHYEYTIPEFTVTYTNGDVLTYTDVQDIEYDGSYYGVYSYDDQDYYNQWRLGKHSATIKVLGFESTFNVNVIETPVAEVAFSDINMIENANCYTVTEDDGTEWNEYFYFTPQCTITMKDNTTTVCDTSIEYLGQRYYFENKTDDQSVDNQWKLGGSYNVSESIMGVEGSYKVNIVENPVAGIHIDDITLRPGEILLDYLNIEITLNDGTVITVPVSENYGGIVEYDGQKYHIMFWSDDETQDGTELMHASVLGKETTFNVTYEGEQTTTLYGDANGDGEISVIDATLIQKHLVGLDAIPDSQIKASDVDSNGEITVIDATEIQKYLVGIETYDIIGQPCVL